jgi:hypothetical protein
MNLFQDSELVDLLRQFSLKVTRPEAGCKVAGERALAVWRRIAASALRVGSKSSNSPGGSASGDSC